MRLLSDEAILLEVADLQEGDRLVSLLTRHHGRKRGAARGARRRYSRFAGQLQPLAKAHVTWLERDDRDLVRVRGVEILRPAHRLQGDLEGILLGYYLAEHALVFAPESDADETSTGCSTARSRRCSPAPTATVAARYFEWWALRLAGVFPPPRECPLCGGDLAGGAVLPRGGEGLLCRACAGAGVGLALAGRRRSAFLMRIAPRAAAGRRRRSAAARRCSPGSSRCAARCAAASSSTSSRATRSCSARWRAPPG